MGNSLSYDEYLKQRSALELHPAFQDEPGRRVFGIIDGDGQQDGPTHVAKLSVVR